MKVAAPKGSMLRACMELSVRVEQMKRAFREARVPGSETAMSRAGVAATGLERRRR